MKIDIQDIVLVCKDCFEKFIFSVEEQKFFVQKEFPIPKRCKQCRVARKSRHTNLNKSSYRQMHEIICAQCGEEAQVPFRPIEGRPVYCKLCYQSLLTNRQKLSHKEGYSK